MRQTNPPNQPPVLQGMQHINRYWDDQHHIWSAKIAPGELYITQHAEIIVTVLGSCVAACIRDKITHVGGMNHFMLPQETTHASSQFSLAKTRYGNWAMEKLINEILKNGGSRKNLEVKIFGGGAVLEGMSNDIGDKNISFAFDYLSNEKLLIAASSVGGPYPRKVYFNPHSGRCRIKVIRSSSQVLKDREKAYSKTVASDTDGSVELF
ncbi:MAG: chemoreceptor glutamine deamidase CheD [Pseudomonadales bacterium]|nr:chemoreceptor glutamine deamidase CheD [Pseudomonadales bacterium]